MTTLEKTRRTVEKLEKEVAQLRSFVIGHVGRDNEGEYNPAFVKRVLEAQREMPVYIFKDSKSFLKHLGSNK
jgi:hypothetical protein